MNDPPYAYTVCLLLIEYLGILSSILTLILTGTLTSNGMDNNENTATLSKMFILIEMLILHSVTTKDILIIFSVFKLQCNEIRLRRMPIMMLNAMVNAASTELASNSPSTYWSLNHVDAGLFISNFPPFPPNGFTFAAWVRLEMYPVSGGVIPLYSFCGDNGQGIDAFFQNKSLILRTQLDEKKPRAVSATLPLVPCQWHFLCISHARRSMWRSSVDIYVDGVMYYSSKHAYPTSEIAASDVCTIGTLQYSSWKSACKDYSMQISTALMFKEALSFQEVADVYSLVSGPKFMMSVCSQSEETVIRTRQNKVVEKLLFGYDSRNIFGDCAFDIGKLRLHAHIGDDTQLITTSSLLEALSAVGGASALIPLLLPNADTSTMMDPKAKLPRPLVFFNSMMGPLEFAEIISLISIVVSNSPTRLKSLKLAGGLRTIASILREAPAAFQTPDLLNSVTSLVDGVSGDIEMKRQGYVYILFDVFLWSSASFPVQMLWLGSMVAAVKDNCSELHKWIGVQRILDSLLLVYYFDKKPAENLVPRPRIENLSEPQISQLRECLLDIIEIFLQDRTATFAAIKTDLCALGVFLSPPTPHEQLNDVLGLLLRRISNGNILKGMRETGTAQILLHLLASGSEAVRVQACGLFSILCASTLSFANKRNEPVINLDNLLGSRKIPPGTTFNQLLYLHVEGNMAPMSLLMYHALMDFAMNVPYGLVEHSVLIDNEVNSPAASRVKPIIFDGVLYVILKLLPAADVIVQRQALEDISLLVESNVRGDVELAENAIINMEKIANLNCWNRTLSYLIMSPDSAVGKLSMDISCAILFWCLSTFHDGSNMIDMFRVELEITASEVQRSQLTSGDDAEVRSIDFLLICTTFQTSLLERCGRTLLTKNLSRRSAGAILWNNTLRLAYHGIDFCLGDSPYLANNQWLGQDSEPSSPSHQIRESRSRSSSFLGIDMSKRLRSLYVPYLLDFWRTYLLPSISEGSDDIGLSLFSDASEIVVMISSRDLSVSGDPRPLFNGGAVRRLSWMLTKILRQIIFGMNISNAAKRLQLANEAMTIVTYLSKVLVNSKILLAKQGENKMNTSMVSPRGATPSMDFRRKAPERSDSSKSTNFTSGEFVLVPTYSDNMFNLLLALQVIIIEMINDIITPEGEPLKEELFNLFATIVKEVSPLIKDAEKGRFSASEVKKPAMNYDDKLYHSMLIDVFSAVTDRKPSDILSLENWTQLLRLPLFAGAYDAIKDEMDGFQQILLTYNVQKRASLLDEYEVSNLSFQNVTLADYECLLPFSSAIEEGRIASTIKVYEHDCIQDSRAIYRFIRYITNSVGVWEDVTNVDLCLDNKSRQFSDVVEKSLWKCDRYETGSRMRISMKRNYREQTYLGYARKENEISDDDYLPARLPLDIKGVAVRTVQDTIYEAETDEDDESVRCSLPRGEPLSWQDIENNRLEVEKMAEGHALVPAQEAAPPAATLVRSNTNTNPSSSATTHEDWDLVDMKRNPVDTERNERVIYAIAAELILPMCVISGRLEITMKYLFFNPEVGTSFVYCFTNKEVFDLIMVFIFVCRDSLAMVITKW